MDLLKPVEIQNVDNIDWLSALEKRDRESIIKLFEKVVVKDNNQWMRSLRSRLNGLIFCASLRRALFAEAGAQDLLAIKTQCVWFYHQLLLDNELRFHDSPSNRLLSEERSLLSQKLEEYVQGIAIRCGYKPIHLFAFLGDIEMIDFLKASINAKTEKMQTPLHMAALSGELEAVKYLVEIGAEVNARDSDGNTPLCLAIERRRLEVTKYLLSHIDTGKALHAVLAKQTESNIVMTLLQQCENFEAEDEEGWTLLQRAVYYSRNRVVDFLLENGADFTRLTPDGLTLLHIELMRCFTLRNLDKLLSFCADINARDSKRETPLHKLMGRAVIPESALEILLSHGADANARNLEGESPLHKLMKSVLDQGPAIGVLLSFDANINEKNSDIATPLHVGAKYGLFENIKNLVEAGADLTQKDRFGCTFLHYFIRRAKLNEIQYLVEKGADVHAICHKGWSVSDWLGHDLHAKNGVLKKLTESNDPRCTQIYNNITSGDKVFKYLLEIGAGMFTTKMSRENKRIVSLDRGCEFYSITKGCGDVYYLLYTNYDLTPAVKTQPFQRVGGNPNNNIYKHVFEVVTGLAEVYNQSESLQSVDNGNVKCNPAHMLAFAMTGLNFDETSEFKNPYKEFPEMILDAFNVANEKNDLGNFFSTVFQIGERRICKMQENLSKYLRQRMQIAVNGG